MIMTITSSLNALLYTLSGLVVGSLGTYYVMLMMDGSRRRNVSPFVRRKQMEADTAATEGRGVAHVDFLTGIVAQLWDYLNPAGSAMIREILEPMLVDYKLTLVNVDLGKTPLHIANVVVHEHNPEKGCVQFDFDVIWDAACDIQMKSSLGNFGLKSIHLGGRLSMLLKPLCGALPCVKAIQYAFINQPHLALDFSGLAAVADFGIIDAKIQNILHDTLANMLVLPHRMTYRLDSQSSLLDIYSPPIGVVRVTVLSGRAFQVQKKGLPANHDIPDVYCYAQMGNQKPLRTPTIPNCTDPVWDSGGCVMDFLAFDYDQIITFNVWDEDKGLMDEDDELGWCQATIRDLLLAKGRTKEMELLTDDSDAGTGTFLAVQCDLCPLTKDLNSLKDLTAPDPMCLGGLLTILITEASHIPLAPKDAATFVKVTVLTGESNAKMDFATSVVMNEPGVDALNPTYDGVFHIPLQTGAKPNITLELMNGKDTVLGTTTISYHALTTAPDMTLKGMQDIGGASVGCSIALQGIKIPKKKISKPMAPTSTATVTTEQTATSTTTSTTTNSSRKSLPSSLSTPSSITNASHAESFGLIQVTVEKGTGFKVRKRPFKKDDIPDIFAKVTFGKAAPVWTTSVIQDSIRPVWNESKSFPLSRHSDVIHISVYDKNRGAITKDTFVGSATITVEKMLLTGQSADLDIMRNGVKTGCVITIRCDMLD